MCTWYHISRVQVHTLLILENLELKITLESMHHELNNSRIALDKVIRSVRMSKFMLIATLRYHAKTQNGVL